jgi:hypothetical protein
VRSASGSEPGGVAKPCSVGARQEASDDGQPQFNAVSRSMFACRD